jgi:hypothetical protein
MPSPEGAVYPPPHMASSHHLLRLALHHHYMQNCKATTLELSNFIIASITYLRLGVSSVAHAEGMVPMHDAHERFPAIIHWTKTRGLEPSLGHSV